MKQSLSRLLVGTLVGAAVGLLSVGAYLLFGGEVRLLTAGWAYIVFLPGVLAGRGADELLGLDEGACVIIGVAGVGIGYGALGFVAAVACAGMQAIRRRFTLEEKQEMTTQR